MENKPTQWADVAHLYQQHFSNTVVFVNDSDSPFRSRGTIGMMYSRPVQAGDLALTNPKPVLRHLGDMTEADALELNGLLPRKKSALIPDRLMGDNIGVGAKVATTMDFVLNMPTEALLWLLNRGFDLFGLIESGQAIRKEVESGN